MRFYKGSMGDPLAEYKEKRRFEKTPEPAPVEKNSGKDIFVVQKHLASRLHYDLRLEVGGVLKSWAVPKGPSLNPADKRLAVVTEDHPLDYAGFEGVIPEGLYGAGTVMVWDTGTYENTSEKDGKRISMDEGLRKGHISFKLHGKKLKGAFSMVLMKGRGEGNWLIMKADDGGASNKDVLTEKPDSALTGRSLEDITKARK